MWRAALAALALFASACGGERPQPVPVGEAPDATAVARPGARLAAALDTVYADSGLFVDPRLRPDSLRRDSLRADSLRRDSLRADSLARARPDFRTFWPAFQAALRADTLRPADARSLAILRVEGPLRERVLSLTARDFRRDSTGRRATVRVGYDGEGRVVPEDEAVRDESLTLAFDVGPDGYGLVSVEREP